MLDLTTFVHITDPDTIQKMWAVHNTVVEFMNHYKKKAIEYGFKRPCFECDYSGGFLFRKRYVGMLGNYMDCDKLSDRFKVVKQNTGIRETFMYEARKSNKEFYEAWVKDVHLNKHNEAHMNDLIPLVFSKVEKDPIMLGDREAYYANPISEIKWRSIEGGVLVVLSWFGRSKDDYEIDSKHTVIRRSEWYRLKGE